LLEKDQKGVWRGTETLPIDKSKDYYQYKFVINDDTWVLNDKLPQRTSQEGHQNNCIDLTEQIVKVKETTDIRSVRRQLGKLSSENISKESKGAVEVIGDNTLVTV
jgi:hypothetical protein